MAEILIPVKNPPKNCHECKNGWCNLWEQNKNMTTGKHPDCPMKELPPHGDLKDADAIDNWLKEQHVFSMSTTCKIDSIIKATPTIIEASTEGEATT